MKITYIGHIKCDPSNHGFSCKNKSIIEFDLSNIKPGTNIKELMGILHNDTMDKFGSAGWTIDVHGKPICPECNKLME